MKSNNQAPEFCYLILHRKYDYIIRTNTINRGWLPAKLYSKTLTKQIKQCIRKQHSFTPYCFA